MGNYNITTNKNTKGMGYMSEITEKTQEECAAEAALKNSLEIALNLLRLGKLTISEIGSSTKLSIDTVKQLATDNNTAYTL